MFLLQRAPAEVIQKRTNIPGFNKGKGKGAGHRVFWEFATDAASWGSTWSEEGFRMGLKGLLDLPDHLNS